MRLDQPAGLSSSAIKRQPRLLHSAHLHCTLHFAFCTLHFAFCTLHFALCTLHFALCILHFALCTLHFALCTLHFAFCTLHFAFCIVSCLQPSDSPLEDNTVLLPRCALCEFHLWCTIQYNQCPRVDDCSCVIYVPSSPLPPLSVFQLLKTITISASQPASDQRRDFLQIRWRQMLNICMIEVCELHAGVSTIPGKYLPSSPCFNPYFHHIWHKLWSVRCISSKRISWNLIFHRCL